MNEATPVDRCVCCHVWFADILRESRETGAGFAALQEKLGFGRGCGMCVPYVRVALATGHPAQGVFEAAYNKLARAGPALTESGKPLVRPVRLEKV